VKSHSYASGEAGQATADLGDSPDWRQGVRWPSGNGPAPLSLSPPPGHHCAARRLGTEATLGEHSGP
jgi:hypothetical protein